MITVMINGKPAPLDMPMTVQAYLEMKGLAGRQLAVAVNGTVLRREEFASVTVNDGDRMEIVRPVGGGQRPERVSRRLVRQAGGGTSSASCA